MAIRVQRASHSSILKRQQNNNNGTAIQEHTEARPEHLYTLYIKIYSDIRFTFTKCCISHCTYQSDGFFPSRWADPSLKDPLRLSLFETRSFLYLWEVRTTDRPSLITLRMQFQRKRLAFGSIPVVGSS